MKKGLAAIISSLILASQSLFAYDKNDNYIRKPTIDQVVESTVTVKGFVDAENLPLFSRLLKALHVNEFNFAVGSGILLLDLERMEEYVLTANHVLPSEGNELYNLEKAYVKVNGFPAEIIKMDEQSDLALLKLKGQIPTPFTGKLAEDIELGDYVIGAGYPLYDDLVLYFGRVSSKSKGESFYIYVDGHINSGCSGGPTFVLNRGIPYLAGINAIGFTNKPGISGIVSLEKIEKFLQGTPVHNDYVLEKIIDDPVDSSKE